MIRHTSTYAPFCPNISILPTAFIDYEGAARRAVRSYPGAVDERQALLFALKHTEMRVDNAIEHYSTEAFRRDKQEYAAAWVDRYLEHLEAINK